MLLIASGDRDELGAQQPVVTEIELLPQLGGTNRIARHEQIPHRRCQ